MVSVWGAATLTLSTNEYHISSSSKKAIQAYYLAEAGLEEGIVSLKKDPENFVEFSKTLETGSFAVNKVGSIPGTVTLTSVGIVGDFQKTLTGSLKIIATGGPPSFDEAEYSSMGSMTFNSNETINGDIYAGGSLSFNSNNTITGDIYTAGSASFNSRNTINGNIFVDGSLTFNNNTTINGNIYVKGNLTFKNNTTINGNIYIMGNLDYHKHFSISGDIFYNWDGNYTPGYDIKLIDFN
jgi:hypothetical protein